MRQWFNSFVVQTIILTVAGIVILAVAVFLLLRANNQLNESQNLLNRASVQRANVFVLSELAYRLNSAETEEQQQSIIARLNDGVSSFDTTQETFRIGEGEQDSTVLEDNLLLPILDDMDATWSRYRAMLLMLTTDSSQANSEFLSDVSTQATLLFSYADRLDRGLEFNVEQAEQRTERILGLLLGLIVVVVVVLGWLFYRITAGLNSLQLTAQEYATGNYAARATTKTFTEMAQVGTVLNQMAGQVESVVGGLEGAVESRTRDLQTVVDITSRIAAILNIDVLLQDVVDLVKERFGLYHAHIYLLNEVGDRLVLTSGAGYIGELMVAEKRSIELNNLGSIVARAGRSMYGVVVNDVVRSPDFLAHPLLPDTRSEAAIALVARNQLLGVLDVQSDQVEFFTDDLYAILEVTATQISAALNNARLFETLDRTTRHEQLLSNISRQIETATDMDEILQTTARELGKALRVPYTAIELQLGQDSES